MFLFTGFCPQMPLHLNQVQDQEGVFTDSEKNKLEIQLKAYSNRQHFFVSVVTTENIAPYKNILSYAANLGNQPEYEKTEVVIAISKKRRLIAIATSRRLEKILTDSICKQVLDSVFIPHFKKDEYFTGVYNGVKSLLIHRNRINKKNQAVLHVENQIINSSRI